ncbi:energy transducer TonB [Hymenobacter sp. UYP22]|uniref:energy transducer TonB n=1 Tax=Hymenobacter sp. UYP22 TaxID=3156348 RepID=UPI00339156FC
MGCHLLSIGAMLFSKGCQQPIRFTETLPTVAVQAPDTCTQAAAAARRDFAARRYELHSIETLPVENAYHDVLRMDYNIQWSFVGEDGPGSYWQCYDSALWPLLEQKYGAGFGAHVSHKADSLDKTGRWNRYPEFPGGTEAMFLFFQRSINWQTAKPNGKRVFMGFTIQANGQVTNVVLMKGIGNPYDNEALRVVRQMPRWKPAYRQGQACPIQFTVPVKFERQSPMGSE